MAIETELLYASRMMLVALIGGLIGWERERHASDAGIRTFMAISIGACAFSLISAHAATDPTRIAAQVVTGIGFIGAGVIFQDKGGVAGLTTAATLWATAAVGMASAFGMYVLALVTGGLIFATLALHHLPGWKRLSQGSGPGGGNPGNPCPKCGSANANEARFCQQCGTSLSPGKCSGCGAELAAGTKFCGQCGQPQQ